jgi:aldehyde dehydrogenase (NAD+)
VLLSLAPLLGALAAGNCAVLKPSEKYSATAVFLARYLPTYCARVSRSSRATAA